MSIFIAAEHPALEGHFPGNPVVPGVLLFDHILDAVNAALPAYWVTGIRKLKFLRAVLPGENFSVQCTAIQNNRLRFTCTSDEGHRIAEGHLLVERVR